MGFTISSSSKDNVASAIFAYTQSAAPTSFPGLFLVQNRLNSPKVTKKVLVFQKVARSCSLTKKLFKILKVAEKLPSRIWIGLSIKEKRILNNKSPETELIIM